MIRYLLFLVLFIFFIFEGTVFQIIAPDMFGTPYTFVPRWVFAIIIFAGIYRGRATGTMYAVIFGVIYDVVFMSILGIYAFGMGLIAYLLSISIPFFQRNLPIIVITCMIAIATIDYYIYGMMLLLGLTSIVHEEFLYTRFIPSLLFNFVFVCIAAYPLKKMFQYIKRKREEAEKV